MIRTIAKIARDTNIFWQRYFLTVCYVYHFTCLCLSSRVRSVRSPIMKCDTQTRLRHGECGMIWTISPMCVFVLMKCKYYAMGHTTSTDQLMTLPICILSENILTLFQMDWVCWNVLVWWKEEMHQECHQTLNSDQISFYFVKVYIQVQFLKTQASIISQSYRVSTK